MAYTSRNTYATENAYLPQSNKAHASLRPPHQQLGRHHVSTLTSSDDSGLINQVMETDRSHDRAFDATPVALKHILQAVDAIFSRFTKPDIHGNLLVQGSAVVNRGAHTDALEHHEKALLASLGSLHDNYEIPCSLFNAISCVISCKWMSGEGANKTTMDILHLLQTHDWDEKLVLALGAFAVKDGEFRLMANHYNTNPLAKAIGTLRQLPEILERASTVTKSKFDAYNDLVGTVIKVSKCIVELHELVRRDPHLTSEVELGTVGSANIPTAVYWTIRSIVVAASQLLGITGMGPE